MAITTTTTILLVAIPLVIWRMYSRIRRLIGRQQSKPWRHWCAVIFFPLLIVLIGISTMGAPWPLAALIVGVASGAALSVWGLRHTVFEKTDSGYYFTPNPYIGITLSLLLVARVGFRFYQMAMLSGADAQMASQNFSRSPTTTIVFGLLAGYYTCYAFGLLRWRRSGLH